MKKFAKIAFLFPGQGAQYPGMAKDFVENFAIARHTFEEADDLLGRKLSTIILEGPENVLTETKNSQLGIFVASMAMLRVLQEQLPHLKPAVCAGLSLGEYTALCASNRLSFAETLALVDHRGRYMNDACEEIAGTMAVVLGLQGDEVETLVKEVNLPNDLWAANFNCPGQTVISGTTKGIQLGTEAAKARGAKRVLPLQVHGAFHSGLMASAERRLSQHIQLASLANSDIAFVMNVPGDFVSENSVIKEDLIKQVTSPVRWEQGIRRIADSGVTSYIEIGCGKSLSGFNKRIQVTSSTFSLEKVEDLQMIEQEEDEA
ncbi:MAG: ACP S-malonyltransferase [Parachlamydiaceae bacterium]